VVIGRTRETLEATGFDWVVCDVRDAERLGEVASSLDDVEVLVNCAGGQFAAAADEISPNGWRAVVETNLTGTWNACRAFRAGLAADGGGAIVNVVANVWQRAAPGMAHAGAARAGVVSLTRTLAVEWAPEIRVNALSPGPVDTPALRAYGDVEVTAAPLPLRRLGTPEEMAEAVRYLLAATYVTGTVLVADGGHQLA
jgi:NAD(P)-dependent dehydrogenase (short-subunit alcohol dehydrogenase family)